MYLGMAVPHDVCIMLRRFDRQIETNETADRKANDE